MIHNSKIWGERGQVVTMMVANILYTDTMAYVERASVMIPNLKENPGKSLPWRCIKVEAKALKKPYNDDLVLICIHLTATSQSVRSCFEPVDHSKSA